MLIEIEKTFQCNAAVITEITQHNFHDLVDDITEDQYEEAGGENITPESLCNTLTHQVTHSMGHNSFTARISGLGIYNGVDLTSVVPDVSTSCL